MFACSLPPDHGGDHELHPAHRLYWERREGVPVPSKFFVMPRDGQWDNLDPDNWELRTIKRVRRESAPEKLDKTCTDCFRTMSIDSFPKKRNVCTDCWKDRLRNNTRNRRSHAEEFKCVLLDGKHHHLLTRQDVLDYWITDHLIRLRGEKTAGAYRRAVHHWQKLLHNAVTKSLEDNHE